MSRSGKCDVLRSGNNRGAVALKYKTAGFGTRKLLIENTDEEYSQSSDTEFGDLSKPPFSGRNLEFRAGSQGCFAFTTKYFVVFHSMYPGRLNFCIN